MRIIIQLPKPRRSVVVDSYASGTDVTAVVAASGLVQPVKRDAIRGVQLVPPQHMRVLLMCMQPNVEDRVPVNAIVLTDLPTGSYLY